MRKQAEKKKFNFGQFYGKYGIALIFVVIFIAASLFVPGFLSTYNLKSILLAIACTTVLGFGATFIIILGHINIAYGSEIAFIGCIACMVDVATGSVWAAIAVALVIGVVLGALTGFIITKFSIPAFIMTLALTEAARGGAVLVTKGNTISGISSGFTFMGQGYVGPIPMAVIILLLCFAVMWVILNKTPYGRYIYAVGGNPKAAEASGISPKAVTFKAYLLDGALVGVGQPAADGPPELRRSGRRSFLRNGRYHRCYRRRHLDVRRLRYPRRHAGRRGHRRHHQQRTDPDGR